MWTYIYIYKKINKYVARENDGWRGKEHFLGEIRNEIVRFRLFWDDVDEELLNS